MRSAIQLLDAYNTWRTLQEQLLVKERQLSEAWHLCVTAEAPEPKELLAQVGQLRYESDRLLRNVIVGYRILRELQPNCA